MALDLNKLLHDLRVQIKSDMNTVVHEYSGTKIHQHHSDYFRKENINIEKQKDIGNLKSLHKRRFPSKTTRTLHDQLQKERSEGKRACL